MATKPTETKTTAKRGRKSAADKAAEAAAKLAQETTEQEIALVKTKDGESVSVDLEPATTLEAPEKPVEEVSESTPVDGITEGEKAPENEAGETTEELHAVEKAEIDAELVVEVAKKAEKAEKKSHKLEENFKPILRPTSVAGEPKGYIACPKVVFDLVQQEGWEDLIESHKAKVALKSVLYWKTINGSATVRCMSSSRFAEAK